MFENPNALRTLVTQNMMTTAWLSAYPGLTRNSCIAKQQARTYSIRCSAPRTELPAFANCGDMATRVAPVTQNLMPTRVVNDAPNEASFAPMPPLSHNTGLEHLSMICPTSTKLSSAHVTASRNQRTMSDTLANYYTQIGAIIR